MCSCICYFHCASEILNLFERLNKTKRQQSDSSHHCDTVRLLLCFFRSGEEDSGPAAGGEEDSGVPRGGSRHRRMVPGARRPPAEGDVLFHCQMVDALRAAAHSFFISHVSLVGF